MGQIIEFPIRAKAIDEAIIELARMISEHNGASDEDRSFMEAEAKQIYANYFPRSTVDVSIDHADSPQQAEEIRNIISEAILSLHKDSERNLLRMAAEILTLKLMLRRRD